MRWYIWFFGALFAAIILFGIMVAAKAQTQGQCLDRDTLTAGPCVRPAPAATIERPDLVKLDQIIQTTIPPAYSGRLIEWINEMVKRQADKDKEQPR